MTEDDGTSLLRDLARAMCALSALGGNGVISLPYPPVVQLALDRVVRVCLDSGERPPGSVPALVDWCGERNPDQWPFTLPAGLLRPNSVLVDPRVRMPTRTCVELCADGTDGAPDQVARQLIHRLSETNTGAGSIDSIRTFLIDHPLLDRTLVQQQPRLMAIWRRVQSLYAPVPAMHRFERFVPSCPACGLVARLDAEHRLVWCEGELCPRDVAVPDPMPAADVMMLLCGPLRQFLALPGRVERQLRTSLADLGVSCALADAPDGTFDLGIPIHGRRIVRVVDRIEPTLFATVAADWPNLVIVVPDRLIECSPAYRTAFADAMPPASDVLLMSASELVAFVQTTVLETGHA